MKRLKKLLFLFLTAILFPVGGWAAESFNIDINGYISQGFMISNRNNYLAKTEKGSFQFNELGINFSTELTDKLRVGIQLAARDLGDTGNDKVIIDWAFADYRWKDWLGLRVGKIKIPLGFYSKTRDIDMVRTSILLPQSIYGETYRDTSTAMKGIGGYGELSLNALGDVSYQVLFGTLDISKESSTTKAAEINGRFEVGKYDIGNLYCWAIIWETPVEGLRIGACREKMDMKINAALTGDMTVPVPFPPFTMTIAEKGTAITVDLRDSFQSVYSLEYIWRELVLAAEYSRKDHMIISRISGLDPTERKTRSDSFYGSAAYRFSDLFEAGIYYSVFYRNRDDRDGTKKPYDPVFNAYQKDACLSLRFDLNKHWIFKLEGHLLDGTALCFPQDNMNAGGVPEFDRKWFLAAAKMTFTF